MVRAPKRRWYERQSEGLGVEFVAKVRAVVAQIAADPERHPIVHGDVRKSLVKRFPYAVIYREEPGEVIVVSVFHTARDPAVWKSRV